MSVSQMLYKVQKRVWDPQNWKPRQLSTAMWVLGIKPEPS